MINRPDNLHNTSVEAFIAAQSHIRIMTDAEPGYGDQVSNLNVIKRLRQMGFNGKIELIYPNVVTDKIVTLYGLPENITDAYYDKRQQIEFVKLKEQVARDQNNPLELASLGMSGANGGGRLSWLLDNDKIDLSTVNATTLANDNYANFVQSQAFIYFSPYPPDGGRRGSSVLQKFDDANGIEQESSRWSFIVTPVSTLSQASEYLANNPIGQAIDVKKPALQTLITAMQNTKYNILPAYGYTLIDWAVDSAFNSVVDATNLLQMILGARYAQLNGGDNLRKPLIMIIFYDLKPELIQQLLSLINNDHWGELEKPGAIQMRQAIKDLSLQKSFSTARVSDTIAINQIQQLSTDQFLMIETGGLPQVIFDGLYTHTAANILPQIREGANSFSSLILTGKPHLRCPKATEIENPILRWEVGFKQAEGNFKIRFEEFYNVVCDGMDKWQAWPLQKMIGDYIIDAQNADSELSKYFKTMQNEALKPENDRIRNGIQGAMDLVASEYAVTDLPQKTEPLRAISSATRAVPFYSGWASYLSSSTKPVRDFVYHNLINKPITELGNFASFYFDNLCQTIRECETYFPSNNRNLWNSGANPNALFHSSANNINNTTSYLASSQNVSRIA